MSEIILIVEDEPKLADLLRDYLLQAGFVPILITNGKDALPRLKQVNPALVLLDLMLPGRDGLDICRDIRSFSTIPIIMITARVEEVDRILGLELGADDYICKPFSPREVVTRVKTVLRRTGKSTVQIADLELDEASYHALIKNNKIALTSVEFKLLQLLMSSPGRIYNRQQLMNHIYSDDRIVSDRTIDSHVKKLRRKLSQLLPRIEIIHSIYGVGYKFEYMEELHTAQKAYRPKQ